MQTSTDSVPVHVSDLRQRIDQRLAACLPGASAEAGPAPAMRTAVLGPGKRLRPLLVLLAGEALGARPSVLLDAACAVELVHAASLVLDDLPCMDDAPLRRGQPALHRRYGEDTAVLAAVGLLARAGQLVAAAPLPAAVRCRMAELLHAAVGIEGLVLGQWRDLRGDGAQRRGATRVNDLKTGVLFAAALELAALGAGREDALPALREAGVVLGRAFQLRDDLEDAQDAPQLECSLVALLGPQDAARLLQATLARAQALLQGALGRDARLNALVASTFAAPLAVTEPHAGGAMPARGIARARAVADRLGALPQA